MIHIPGKYKFHILLFILLLTVIIILLINHSGYYIYLNINDPDDRITQRTYSDYIAYGGVFDGNGKTISGLSIDNTKK